MKHSTANHRNRSTDPPNSPGTLYVVATPIGNLSDMTPRAVEVLRAVELVLAEDTRTFARLARSFEINTKCVSYHDHNEESQTARIVPLLQSGLSVALVSEAGTPGISDPGYRIIKACSEAGIPLSPIPGTCAAIAALSISGFEISSFSFRGFVPVKPGKRQTFLRNIIEQGETTVLYESPHRIIKTLTALEEVAPNSDICLARELTKQHEEIIRGTPQSVSNALASRKEIRGEIVVVIRGSL